MASWCSCAQTCGNTVALSRPSLTSSDGLASIIAGASSHCCKFLQLADLAALPY